MAWIESHQALAGHPKVLNLAHRMSWSLDETIGKLHRFWWWCLDYAVDGDLRKYNDAVLAGCVDLVPEQASLFVNSMVAARWLDRKPYFRIHDWWTYTGRYLQVKYKHNPVIWQEIHLKYQNLSKNAPRTRSKNRSNKGCESQDLTNQPTNLLPTNQPTEEPVDTVDCGEPDARRGSTPSGSEKPKKSAKDRVRRIGEKRTMPDAGRETDT